MLATELMTNDASTTNVVNLQQYKNQTGKKFAEPADYTPTSSDVEAFARIIRFLHHKTATGLVTIATTNDEMSIVLTDEATSTLDEAEFSTDVKQRKITVPFPFILLDVAEQELSIVEDGKTVINLFCDRLSDVLAGIPEAKR